MSLRIEFSPISNSWWRKAAHWPAVLGDFNLLAIG